MHTINADAAWTAVTATDPTVLDRDGLACLLSSIERVRAVCAVVEVVAVRRSRALADCGTGEPAENLLTSATGSSSRQAHLAVGREQACEAMPAIESALSHGLLSAAHVDAAASVHARLNPDVAAAFADHSPDLAQRASTLSVDVFERECRDLARHLQQRADADAEVAELDLRGRRRHAPSNRNGAATVLRCPHHPDRARERRCRTRPRATSPQRHLLQTRRQRVHPLLHTRPPTRRRSDAPVTPSRSQDPIGLPRTQNSRCVSCRRYSPVRGSSGPISSRMSTNC